MTRRCNSQPANWDNGDSLRPRHFLKLAVVIGFMIAVALIALYYRNFLIILIIIAVWISWTTTENPPRIAHIWRLCCAILNETVAGFSTRFSLVSPFKFQSRYCSLHIHGLNKSFWSWTIYLLAICARIIWKGQNIAWVTSKSYNERHVDRRKDNWVAMEFSEPLWNEALLLLQIEEISTEDKYTFICSIQR